MFRWQTIVFERFYLKTDISVPSSVFDDSVHLLIKNFIDGSGLF